MSFFAKNLCRVMKLCRVMLNGFWMDFLILISKETIMTDKRLKYQHFSSNSCRVLVNFRQFCNIFAKLRTWFPPMITSFTDIQLRRHWPLCWACIQILSSLVWDTGVLLTSSGLGSSLQNGSRKKILWWFCFNDWWWCF